MENTLKFRRVIWSSKELLNNLSLSCFSNLNSTTKDAIHDEMWRNVIAEHDSINLSQRLRQLNIYTPQFLSFEKIWVQDEINHYLGLRKIYCTIYDLNETDIHNKIASRTADFNDLEDMLLDEFALCVCFAYDELASTRGYSEAFPLYDSFNIPEVSKWIRYASRDEWYHCLNAQMILKTVYKNEMDRVPSVLRQIVKQDHEGKGGYKATFLFDHDPDPEHNPFNIGFLRKCANDICRFLNTEYAFQEIST